MRGDVYMVDLEPTAGHEQRGHRPVVVVSTERFDRLTSCPVILPVTNGGNFVRRMGFAVSLTDTKTIDIVHCDQPRALGLDARNGRKVESQPSVIMDEVLATAAAIFE